MEGTVFVTEPIDVEIDGGIAKVRLKSDGAESSVRMSIHTLMASLERLQRAIDKWSREQGSKRRKRA